MGLIDCHNHLQDERLAEMRPQIVEDLRSEGVTWWGVAGTSEDDWEEVARLAEAHPEVMPSFGLHPWKVEGRSHRWKARLRDCLERFPGSGVGEIGLDKWIRDADIDDQKVVFREQLAIAAELGRPVTIHCLQAWGSLLEEWRACGAGIRAVLHSFGGPTELLDDFAGAGAWFSLSGYFFRRDKRRKLEVFRSVPGDRLLLETDAPDMALPAYLDSRGGAFPGDGAECSVNHPANITVVYTEAARFLGEDVGSLAERMERNAERWWKG